MGGETPRKALSKPPTNIAKHVAAAVPVTSAVQRSHNALPSEKTRSIRTRPRAWSPENRAHRARAGMFHELGGRRLLPGVRVGRSIIQKRTKSTALWELCQ